MADQDTSHPREDDRNEVLEESEGASSRIRCSMSSSSRSAFSSSEDAYILFTVWCSKSSRSHVICGVVAKRDPRIETLEREIATLVEQRQTLRATEAEPGELERNRREIVARQHELSET